MWDFESGGAIFEYGDAHGEHAITCLTFDNTNRRSVGQNVGQEVRIQGQLSRDMDQVRLQDQLGQVRTQGQA